MLINYNQRDNNCEIIDNNTSINQEVCNICYDEIDKSKDISILKCGHKFHYKCILETYKNQNTRNSKNSTRTCPYCRENGGYLLLKPGMIPQNCIHKEYKDYINGKIEIVKYIPGKCKYILKKGQNAGFQCSLNEKNNGYCTRHFKLLCNKNCNNESKNEEIGKEKNEKSIINNYIEVI